MQVEECCHQRSDDVIGERCGDFWGWGGGERLVSIVYCRSSPRRIRRDGLGAVGGSMIRVGRTRRRRVRRSRLQAVDVLGGLGEQHPARSSARRRRSSRRPRWAGTGTARPGRRGSSRSAPGSCAARPRGRRRRRCPSGRRSSRSSRSGLDPVERAAHHQRVRLADEVRLDPGRLGDQRRDRAGGRQRALRRRAGRVGVGGDEARAVLDQPDRPGDGLEASRCGSRRARRSPGRCSVMT